MKGYKAFDKDLKCRGMQYKVGDTFTVEGEILICKNGIHFCEKLNSVFNCYPKNRDTRVCEIEAIGEIQTEGDKSVCSKIKIIRELSRDEIDNLTDSLRFNSGYFNSGSHNSGDRNSGYFNSGSHNSGDFNSGYFNSGDFNSGDFNSGYFNSGDFNSGNRNSGNRNSGDFNSGDFNSGYFNSTASTVRLFNRDSGLSFDDPRITRVNQIISHYWKPHLEWIYSDSMTEKEKQENPSHETTGGFLRSDTEYCYKKSWKNVWNKCSKEERDFIQSLPNFDKDVFKEITGIDVIETIEVTVNGVIKTINKEDAIKLGLI